MLLITFKTTILSFYTVPCFSHKSHSLFIIYFLWTFNTQDFTYVCQLNNYICLPMWTMNWMWRQECRLNCYLELLKCWHIFCTPQLAISSLLPGSPEERNQPHRRQADKEKRRVGQSNWPIKRGQKSGLTCSSLRAIR